MHYSNPSLASGLSYRIKSTVVRYILAIGILLMLLLSVFMRTYYNPITSTETIRAKAKVQSYNPGKAGKTLPQKQEVKKAHQALFIGCNGFF